MTGVRPSERAGRKGGSGLGLLGPPRHPAASLGCPLLPVSGGVTCQDVLGHSLAVPSRVPVGPLPLTPPHRGAGPGQSPSLTSVRSPPPLCLHVASAPWRAGGGLLPQGPAHPRHLGRIPGRREGQPWGGGCSPRRVGVVLPDVSPTVVTSLPHGGLGTARAPSGLRLWGSGSAFPSPASLSPHLYDAGEPLLRIRRPLGAWCSAGPAWPESRGRQAEGLGLRDAPPHRSSSALPQRSSRWG